MVEVEKQLLGLLFRLAHSESDLMTELHQFSSWLEGKSPEFLDEAPDSREWFKSDPSCKEKASTDSMHLRGPDLDSPVFRLDLRRPTFAGVAISGSSQHSGDVSVVGDGDSAINEDATDENRVDEDPMDEDRVDEDPMEEDRVDEDGEHEDRVDENRENEKKDEDSENEDRVDEKREDEDRADADKSDENRVDRGRVDEDREDENREDENMEDENREDENRMDEDRENEDEVDKDRMDDDGVETIGLETQRMAIDESDQGEGGSLQKADGGAADKIAGVALDEAANDEGANSTMVRVIGDLPGEVNDGEDDAMEGGTIARKDLEENDGAEDVMEGREQGSGVIVEENGEKVYESDALTSLPGDDDDEEEGQCEKAEEGSKPQKEEKPPVTKPSKDSNRGKAGLRKETAIDVDDFFVSNLLNGLPSKLLTLLY